MARTALLLRVGIVVGVVVFGRSSSAAALARVAASYPTFVAVQVVRRYLVHRWR